MEALLEYIKQRSVSTYVVSYSVFWSMIHWEKIYTTLFVSQDLIMQETGLLKSIYVKNCVPTLGLVGICGVIVGAVVPAILAFCYVFFLPYFLDWIYKREIKHRINREVVKIEESVRIDEAEEKRAEARAKKSSAELKLSKTRAEMVKNDPEILWSEEYNDFMAEQSGAKNVLDQLQQLIFTYDGDLTRVHNSRIVSKDGAAVCYINGLIEYRGIMNEVASLTEKGRYFLKI